MSDNIQHDRPAGSVVPHVVPLRVLFGVLGILVVLTAITVGVSELGLGRYAIVAALVIAFVKAVLVCLYFMHLRWDKPFNAVVLISALALVVLFILFGLLDSFQYQPDTIPGYAPDLLR